ncbi:hybrid-cluster NAD(P)-dependent oxidoreductase [Streptomyces albiaxialis]|uniref:Hybrid-cluster NAD(P)-dependent oxidoreductase n=1 Tax=Streptomyces albiaxialis TaxID=329523 RepID=A0ABN2WNL2_9ACTN
MTEAEMVCVRVERVTHDMRTFVFAPAGPPRLPRHEAGQHLAFTFDIDGEEVERRYTLASPPTRPDTLAITVKRVPGGRVSGWLHAHMVPGTAVRARGPLGVFSTARHPAPAYLFLSGGSGVTPLMSMTRALHDLGSPADVVFAHSARTPDDVPFRRELEGIAASAPPYVRVVHIGEDGGPRAPGPGGRLTPAVLRRIAPDLGAREVFACGPPGYLRAVRAMLAASGFPMDRYHQESFESAQPHSPAEDGGGATHSVVLSRTGTTVECAAGTSVLEAAARAGITLPSSCGQGMCGTCVTTLEKGSVDMRHNGGLRPRDAARDKILLCCSTPLEDLVIDA